MTGLTVPQTCTTRWQKMARQTHLKRRHGRYYWRQRIPTDLARIAGRNEIAKALGCPDLATARLRAALFSANAAIIYQQARSLGYGRERFWAELNAATATPAPQAPLSPPPPFIPAPSLPLQTPKPQAPRHRLSAVIESFCDELDGTWAAKTKLMNTASLRLFKEHQGDRPISEITKNDLREFKELLRKIPPNYTKRFPKLSLTEAAALRLKPISSKTANKILSSISGLFNWATKNGYCTDNPAKGIGIAIRQKPHEERNAFSDDDLNRIFSSPLYTGCASQSRRSAPGSNFIKDERYWLPLIGLYSGMRLEEIAQLRAQDIQNIEGILCFNIHAKNGNTLKTFAAERIVPVHSILISAGFAEHVKKRAASLWPGLSRCSDGTLSAAFSKWFGRYLDTIGLTDPKLTFHSLRHTFANALKQQQVPHAMLQALLGHKDNSITTGRYGKPYSPIVLSETLHSALNFNCTIQHLNLSR